MGLGPMGRGEVMARPLTHILCSLSSSRRCSNPVCVYQAFPVELFEAASGELLWASRDRQHVAARL
jgi:hypothetical protein